MRELRNEGAAVLSRVERGETLIVTRDGVPVAELRPVPRTRVSTAELIRRAKQLPPIDPEQLKADIDELFDQTIDDPYER